MEKAHKIPLVWGERRLVGSVVEEDGHMHLHMVDDPEMRDAEAAIGEELSHGPVAWRPTHRSPALSPKEAEKLIEELAWYEKA